MTKNIERNKEHRMEHGTLETERNGILYSNSVPDSNNPNS